MKSFPHYTLKGSARQIGLQHGRLRKEAIHACFAVYRRLLAVQSVIDLDDKVAGEAFDKKLEERTLRYRTAIRSELPDCAEEIEAIAEAAGLPVWKVYLLNARTELACEAIMQKNPGAGEGECTAFLCPRQLLMAQTWDWLPELEELSAIVEIERPDGFRLAFLSEPGIIGKWGLNSAGVGLLFTILFENITYSGVPVHVLLRVILESRTVIAARERIQQLSRGTSSSLLLLDPSGNSCVLELRGSALDDVTATAAGVHTNHYLADSLKASSEIPGSYFRQQRGLALLDESASMDVERLKTILGDRHDPAYAICRSYTQGVYFPVGTVAAVIIDIKEKSLSIARGQPSPDSLWQTVSLR
jgi:isopenicillin-N N-acyltransferase-like protein